MNEFFDQALTMPTTVFSVLLVLVVLYWLLTMLTGIDWVGDLVEGAGGLADGALEGAADGALEGLADGAGVAGEPDYERGRGPSESKSWLRLLGLGELPSTLTLSLLVAFGWAFSLGGSALATKMAWLTAGGVGVVAVIAVTAVALSIAATMMAVTPLRRFMRFVPATERRQLVGKHARVTTLRVDEDFGQAEVVDLSGAPILIQARSLDLINTIGRGDVVRVVGYQPEREVFLVEASREVVEP